MGTGFLLPCRCTAGAFGIVFGLTDTAAMKLVTFLGEIELQLIKQALHETNENQSRAARLLKIKRTTLISKMKKLGIEKK